MSEVHMELPKYRCHKEVWALKIMDFSAPTPAGGVFILPENPHYAPFEVSKEFMDKHRPRIGGYYVRYQDGYESYSPAEAFESGYTLIK